jgi:hypothetical protein
MRWQNCGNRFLTLTGNWLGAASFFTPLGSSSGIDRREELVAIQYLFSPQTPPQCAATGGQDGRHGKNRLNR